MHWNLRAWWICPAWRARLAAGCTIGWGQEVLHAGCEGGREFYAGGDADARAGPDQRSTLGALSPAVEISQAVTDQFGARTLTKLKTAELCVPAVEGL